MQEKLPYNSSSEMLEWIVAQRSRLSWAAPEGSRMTWREFLVKEKYPVDAKGFLERSLGDTKEGDIPEIFKYDLKIPGARISFANILRQPAYPDQKTCLMISLEEPYRIKRNKLAPEEKGYEIEEYYDQRREDGSNPFDLPHLNSRFLRIESEKTMGEDRQFVDRAVLIEQQLGLHDPAESSFNPYYLTREAKRFSEALCEDKSRLLSIAGIRPKDHKLLRELLETFEKTYSEGVLETRRPFYT